VAKNWLTMAAGFTKLTAFHMDSLSVTGVEFKDLRADPVSGFDNVR
jgi:hypothetical protein